MLNRRKFLRNASYASLAGLIPFQDFAQTVHKAAAHKLPIVISTWDAGVEANKGAWAVLRSGGRALDAVEQGVMITEVSRSCCVGLNGNPDRDGYVTLDASIMDENFNAGGVAYLERIRHPVSVARRVMEKTPHLLLVGAGAQQFAVSEGFPLEPQKLSEDAEKAYREWLKKSEYKPVINIENSDKNNQAAPSKMPGGEWNHDTIGMLALDMNGNLSGSCTTSGMAFKMRGRVGDSPIIGAGLYVDNEVGAAVATGQGEEVIRIAGSSLVVEYMRNGLRPEDACKKAIERIMHIRKDKAKEFQVAFVAINKQGETGAYALQKGFNYAVTNTEKAVLSDSKYFY